MWRRNHLLGCCALAFGLGLLIGHHLASSLLCTCSGIILIVLGFCMLRQK